MEVPLETLQTPVFSAEKDEPKEKTNKPKKQ
jgi:hypothetical protein